MNNGNKEEYIIIDISSASFESRVCMYFEINADVLKFFSKFTFFPWKRKEEQPRIERNANKKESNNNIKRERFSFSLLVS